MLAGELPLGRVRRRCRQRPRESSDQCLLLVLLRRLFLRGLLRLGIGTFHFHVRGAHGVFDSNFGADLQLARDLGAGIAGQFPFVIAFLNGDAGVGDFEHWPGNLIGFRTGEGESAQGKAGDGGDDKDGI